VGDELHMGTMVPFSHLYFRRRATVAIAAATNPRRVIRRNRKLGSKPDQPRRLPVTPLE
jgi:hypothetical protein